MPSRLSGVSISAGVVEVVVVDVVVVAVLLLLIVFAFVVETVSFGLAVLT